MPKLLLFSLKTYPILLRPLSTLFLLSPLKIYYVGFMDFFTVESTVISIFRSLCIFFCLYLTFRSYMKSEAVKKV